MVPFECPWCAEPAMVVATELDEVTCEACGVEIELAPGPHLDRISQAA